MHPRWHDGAQAWRGCGPAAGRGHFFTAAAEAMRWILIEHTRGRAREKRDGPDRRRLVLDTGEVADLAREAKTEQIIALDEALRRLESQRPRVAQVVHLRFCAGSSVVLSVRVAWGPCV